MNPAGDLLRDVFGVVTAIVGIALIAVLVRNARGTAGIISSASSGLSGLFNTLIGGGLGTATSFNSNSFLY